MFYNRDKCTCAVILLRFTWKQPFRCRREEEKKKKRKLYYFCFRKQKQLVVPVIIIDLITGETQAFFLSISWSSISSIDPSAILQLWLLFKSNASSNAKRQCDKRIWFIYLVWEKKISKKFVYWIQYQRDNGDLVLI